MKKMKPDEAAWLLAQIIVNDPSDIRAGFRTEEDARQAAQAMEVLTKDKWLVSEYRPRKNDRTYFLYRVVKGIPPKIHHAAEFDEEE